ncbi:MAG: tyrosine-type recombinase/integrase, partial [Chloroflexota bacterium]
QQYAGGGSKSRRSRLQQFCEWQLVSGYVWYQPALAQWRDYLLETQKLQPTTVRAYLSTVRAAYQQLLRSNEMRQWLYDQMPADLSPERQLALITELEIRLKNDIDPNLSMVTVVDIQDEGDADHLWLTPAQVAALVLTPGVDTLKGLRDTAMMALMLCTGVRAAELLALDVDDLQVMFGSTLALRVKSGKGFKQRLIPYGVQDWGLTLTQCWLDRAGIVSGPVFVGMRKGDNFYLTKEEQHIRLSERSLEYALRDYPISIDGELRTVTPHDLRRTYARQLYLTGTDLTAIQQNMGHTGQDTTLGYIGTLDARQREPDDAYGTTWLRSLWETLAVPMDFPVNDEEMMVEATSPSIAESGGYVFKIVLHDVRPQIWRRFKVPSGITFHTLHDIVQVVMGWENYHLYRFTLDRVAFTAQPMAGDDRLSSELIDTYLTREGQQILYSYDFGDSWGHVLTLEKILTRTVTAPRCMAGNRACPPEDSGGPWIYDEFLRSRRSRKGRVSRKWQHRMGNYWDADAFDLKTINEDLQFEWQRLDSNQQQSGCAT